MVNKNVLRIYYPALLLFTGLTCFMFYAFYELNRSLEARRQKLFEQRVSRVREVLNRRMTDYIQILKGCQSLFYATDEVNNKMWKTYIDNLGLSDNYPGIQAVAFAAMIDKTEVPLLEQKMRSNGFPDFAVRSTFENQRLTPIIYIEPFLGRNLRAFGFDMYSESERRQAMERAMITGQPVLSSKVTLVQETQEDVQPGFLLYLPVYKNPQLTRTVSERKKNIRGFVYNPFRAFDLMNAILENYSDLNIWIYNGKAANEATLLYSSSQTPANAITQKERDDLFSDMTIYISGTQWRIIATPTAIFGSSVEKREPALVLLFGLAITFLMTLISINTIKNQSRAVKELMLSRELERKKDEFIGIAAHELKTPLTSIHAYTQLLQRAELNEREKNLVSKSATQIKKLSSLIADLLDVSKIDAGALKFNMAEFSLPELIHESIEAVSHLYNSHQFVLTGTLMEVRMTGDKLRLEQAITNLLVNAVKYSPAANKVYIGVKQDQEWIVIEIKDEGIGITEKNRERIFEKFYRAEGLSPVFSGLGMGLYIANQIVERHKGTIEIASEPGKGSVFSIRLPLEEGEL